jgi:signal transduction histidine kinase
MSSTLPTQFAPAERASPEEVLRQSQYFADAPPLLHQFLDATPDILTVLNPERQIVFANQRLLDFLKVSLDSVIGQRPGEAIDCVHALDTECGCGTTEFCATCGAAQAILACQRGKADVQECRIIQRANGETLDLRVWTTPLSVDGEQFTIFAVTDISHEKRRQALERIFFHDVMNAATVLLGSVTLLQEKQEGQRDQLTDLIQIGAEKLIDEIKTQQLLTQAENDELTVHPTALSVRSLLQEIADSYSAPYHGQTPRIQVAQIEPELNLISDIVLLRRVIGNMVKNALEASHPGQVITLGYQQRADGIELWVHNPNPMPRHVQLQIFQRSFSTKGAGRGLGTYSMKLLGERYLKGSVFFTSAEEGTVFTIRCPADISSSSAASPSPTSTTD